MSSPAVADGYLHVGTMAGSCYVLDTDSGAVVKEIDCGEPETGQVIWLTTKYYIHGDCTICGENGRPYLGGYNKLEGGNSLVWCVDARDGSMIWKSEPVIEAIQVVTIGPRFLFVHAQYRNGDLLDKAHFGDAI